MVEGPKGGLIRTMQALYDSGSLAGLDDAELLARVLGRGDAAEAAFEAIVARHGAMVYGVCRTVTRSDADADDAFQAVFLILACRAAGVRRRGALGPWLFGVARRTALQARKQAVRRREREAAAASLTPTAVHPRDPDDAVAALMEEVDRLPSRYRDPVVLCHLQGLTYEAAAGRLGCPLGTLSVRLKRARERLRTRLERRGVDAPAVLPPVAAVSEALVAATSRLALLVPPSLRAGVPVSVLTLTRGALRTMRMTRIVVASTAFLALAAGAWAWSDLGRAEEPSRTPATDEADAPDGGKYRISGRVTDADTGGPIAGAIIHILPYPGAQEEHIMASGADGTYSIPLPPGHGGQVWIGAPTGYYVPAESKNSGMQPFALSDARPEVDRDYVLKRATTWEFRGPPAAETSAWVHALGGMSQATGDEEGRLRFGLPTVAAEAFGVVNGTRGGNGFPDARFSIRWDADFDPSAARSVARLDGKAERYWTTDREGRSALFEDLTGGLFEPRVEEGRLVIRMVNLQDVGPTLPEVSGLVVDSSGKPLAGAVVQVIFHKRWETGDESTTAATSPPWRATTNATGRVRLSDLPVPHADGPINAVSLVVRADGFAGATSTTLPIRGREPLDFPPIVLETGCSLVGMVVDPAGRPVVGAFVENDNGCSFLPVRARTDGDGRFRLDGLREGSRVIPTVWFGNLTNGAYEGFRIRRDGEPVTVRLVERLPAAEGHRP